MNEIPLEKILNEEKNEPAPGVLYVVSTPIGNLEDITIRALRILRGVDIIAAEDTRTTKNLLRHYTIDTPCMSYFSQNELKRIPQIIDELKSGKSVAVVSDAGTPALSDPAALLISKTIAENIRVVPIPGASALLSALVTSGFHTDRFIFEGFLPIKKRRSTRIKELSRETRTIILYESPHRILKTLSELHQVLGERRVALCREMTKMFEEIIRGSLTDIIHHVSSHPIRGEYVIIIEGEIKTHPPE